MTIERIVNRMIEWLTGLYYRQWELWEVLGLGVVALIIFVIVVRGYRKTARAERHLHESTPRISN